MGADEIFGLAVARNRVIRARAAQDHGSSGGAWWHWVCREMRREALQLDMSPKIPNSLASHIAGWMPRTDSKTPDEAPPCIAFLVKNAGMRPFSVCAF